MLDGFGISAASEYERDGAEPRMAFKPHLASASFDDRVAACAARGGAVVQTKLATTTILAAMPGGLDLSITRERDLYVLRFERLRLQFSTADQAFWHIEAALDGHLKLIIGHADDRPVAWALHCRNGVRDDDRGWRVIAEERDVDWRFWGRRSSVVHQNAA